MGLEAITFLCFKNLLIAPCFQAENGEDGEGKSASLSAVPPSPLPPEVPDMPAGYTAPY